MKTAGRGAVETLLDQGEVRQDLVFDLDQPGRVDRALLGVSGDSRDFVSLEHDLAGLRLARLPQDERGLHAGSATGRADVHGDDPGVRVRRADHTAVEHAGPGDVEGVLGAAGDLLRAVEPLDRRAHHGSRGRPVEPGIGGRGRGRTAAPASLRRRRGRGTAAGGRRLTLSGWRLTLTLTRRLVIHAAPPSRSRRPRRCA